MSNQRWILVAGIVVSGMLTALPTTAAATTWDVPGNGSNVCTVVNPNCNTIAQAVTASSNGDTIQVGAGSFPLAAAVVLTKTLTVAGAGIGSTFIQPSAGVTAFSVRTNDIVIRDLAIQNGGVGIAFQSAASNNTQITRVSFSGQTSRGIDISLAATFPVTNVAIADCTFSTPNIGLRMSSTSQVTGLTITGSTFSANAYGIYQANDGNTSRLSGLTVQNSTFTNNTNYGIYAEELRDAAIEDSMFTGGSTAIGVFKFYTSNGVAISNIAIRRNQFTAFKGNALDLEVRQLGLEMPITIEGNTIQKDVAIATSAASVFVWLTPTLPNATVDILDNDIVLSGTFGALSAAHGVQLRGNGPVVLTGNTFDGGNVGGSGTTPPSSGIFIQSQSAGVVMPATASISASCNRIEGFRNGVSVFDSVGGVYGGLQVGATVTLTDNAILGNDTGVVTAAAPPTIAAENNYWGCPAGPTDGACDGVTGDVDASPFLATIPACVACTGNAECDDGLFCNGAETCGSGTCVAASDPCAGGPDCENLCNEAADNCNVPGGTPCRPAAGPCDVAETCTGLGGSCPSDTLVSAGTECRPAAGVCDLAETCDGASPACPPDAKSSAVCRTSAGACDLAESCDGVNDACPADAKSTAVCRAAAGVCDVAESCDGVGNSCPTDGFAPASTVCRPAAGACDVAENCTGSGASCPADTGLPDTDGDTVCDALDNCVAIANPSQANGDGDALGDACDPCNNIVPTGQEKAKLTLTRLLAPPSDDKVSFKGYFTNVPGAPTIDPVANGMRFLITDSTGSTPVDVTIPGGAYDVATKSGWKVNGSGTSWTYKNAGTVTPLINGIQKMQLKAVTLRAREVQGRRQGQERLLPDQPGEPAAGRDDRDRRAVRRHRAVWRGAVPGRAASQAELRERGRRQDGEMQVARR